MWRGTLGGSGTSGRWLNGVPAGLSIGRREPGGHGPSLPIRAERMRPQA